MIIHFNDVSHPCHLGSDYQESNAGRHCAVQDLQIGDTVLPINAKDGAENLHVKFLQLFEVHLVLTSGPTYIWERRNNHNLIDFPLCGDTNVYSILI